MCTCFSLAPVTKLCALKSTENRPLCAGKRLHPQILSSIRRAQIITLVLCCGCYDQTDDQTVQAQSLREDEDQDHTYEETRLLCIRPDTCVANNANSQACCQRAHAHSEASTQVCVPSVC